MDKLIAMKIKYDDGTYSDQIPICAYAENVEWDNSHTLVDVLGTVDLNNSIQDQITYLFNNKMDATALENYVATQLNNDVSEWLTAHVTPVGSAVVVDDTLSISGAAADAKKTGDEIADVKSDLSGLENATGIERVSVGLLNGTPPNPGNAYSVRGDSLIHCEFGDTIEIFTDRPNAEGFTYRYGNFWYNESGSTISYTSAPNGTKKFLVNNTNIAAYNFVIMEVDTNGTARNLRVSDFDGYGVWCVVTAIDNVNNVKDIAVPVLRNGTLPNSGNANAISTYYTQPISNASAIALIADVSVPTDGHITWLVYGYNENRIGTIADSSATNRVFSTEISTDNNVLYLGELINKYPVMKCFAVSATVYDDENSPIPLRTNTDGNVLSIHYYYDNGVSVLKNTLQTVIERPTFAYLSDSGTFEFESDQIFIPNTGRCAWRVSNSIAIKFPDATSVIFLAIDDIIATIGTDDTRTSSDGQKWVYLRAGYALVYDRANSTVKTVSVLGSTPFKNSIYPLIIAWSGQIVGGLLFEKFLADADATPYTLFNSNNVKYDIDVKEKCTEVTDAISGSVESELFLFFTDPHTYGHNYNVKTAEYVQTVIQKYYNSSPASFVLAGGDWLTADDTSSEAKYKLGLIAGSMSAMVAPFYPMNGNHDTNYQGEETISNGALISLWFGKWNSLYYTFSGNNTKFYVFDSQLDGVFEMDAYAWEQVEWFGKALETDTEKHIAVGIHIWRDQGTTAPLASNIALVITAYNKRQKITLNGIEYDFTSVNGRVEFVIAGHIHADFNDSIDNAVPVIMTINAWRNSTVCFDFVYADYDERTISCIRVGNGNNRKFSLDTGELLT